MGFESLSEKVEWECRRVATAFGVKAWHSIERYQHTTELAADVSGVGIWCSIHHIYTSFGQICIGPKGKSCMLCLIDGEDTNEVVWEIFPEPPYLHLMVCGLYRLGFDDEYVLEHLPPLSAHEKLELRLSLPREFWPQRWLDEEANQP